jgi:hypothetical protein
MSGQVLILVDNKLGMKRINAQNIDQHIAFKGRISFE